MLTPPVITGSEALRVVMAGRPLKSMTDTTSSTKTVADSPSLKSAPPDAVMRGMLMVTNLRSRDDDSQMECAEATNKQGRRAETCRICRLPSTLGLTARKAVR